jgi:hypothetical protein
MRDWRNITVKREQVESFGTFLYDNEIEFEEEIADSTDTSVQFEVCVDEEEHEALTEYLEELEEYNY